MKLNKNNSNNKLIKKLQMFVCKSEVKKVHANLFLDGLFNILKGLQGWFARNGIRNLLGTLNDFLIKHSLLFPHRHLSGTEFDCDSREL